MISTKFKKNIILLLLVAPLLQSCFLLGIHSNLKNPKKEGKVPHFNQETILLGALTKYRSCFDVYYYDINIDVDPVKKALNGYVFIYAKALTDFDTLQIDLHKNFKITELIDAQNGKKINYKRQERAVFLNFPQKKGNVFVIKVAYNGKPIIAAKPPWEGGFVWKQDKNNNPWIGVACESDGASIWWPLKDHTSDEPDSVRLHYTVPEGLTAVGNGQLENQSTTNKKSTFNWFVSYPINTYNISIYVGKFKLITDEYRWMNEQSLALNYYVLEPNYEKAKNHFKQVNKLLKIYEQKFGDYPWYRDGFKLIESPYAGMEHQTAIAYGNGYKNDLDAQTDYIILHETAHEWWGNSITAKDLGDVWLQEGFATYAEALYMEETKGYNAYLSHLYFYKLFIKNKYPVVSIKDRRWFDYKKNEDVYMKGAWILHTLRIQLNNDELFFNILRSFAERYKYQIVESADFIKLVNELSQTDYTWFFNQYLYKNSIPELEYSYSNDGTFYYKWVNTDSTFNKMKIKIKTQGKTVFITPSNQLQQLSLPTNEYGSFDFTIVNDVLCVIRKNNKLKKTH